MKSKCFRFYRLGNSMIRDNVYEDDRFAGGGGSRWAGRAEARSPVLSILQEAGRSACRLQCWILPSLPTPPPLPAPAM